MRLNDIKALIAVLFVAIMMLTVVQYRERYPWYLSVPVTLAAERADLRALVQRRNHAAPDRG
jgi:hypothetical protein